MKLRKTMAALTLAVLIPTVAACGTDGSTSSTDSGSSSSGSDATSGSNDSSSDSDSETDTAPVGGGEGGPGQSTDPSSVTTEEELVALIQEAYGDGGLGLHRGHQPVEGVLDEVLGISHDELHVRMEEQGQNLASIAEDVGVGQQALVDALVESWSPAIDNLANDGTITDEEADAYLAALEEAFTFRVTWDGEEGTPTFSGIEV